MTIKAALRVIWQAPHSPPPLAHYTTYFYAFLLVCSLHQRALVNSMPSFFRSLSRRSSRINKADEKPANGTYKQNAKGLTTRASNSTLNSSRLASSTPSTTPGTSTTDEVNGPTPAPASAPAHARPQRPNVDPVKRYSANVGNRGRFSAACLLTSASRA